MRASRVSAWIGVACILLGGWHLQAQQGDSPGSTPAVSGSGKTDFIPIWTNSTTLSSSTLFEKSGKVGIGTTTPAATLEVKGTAKFDQAVTFASGQTFPGTAMLGSNTFTGTQTVTSGGVSISNGNLNLPGTTGSTAGVINLGGTAFIHQCCYASGTGYTNTFVGLSAGNFSGIGGWNTGSGYQALFSNTYGAYNTGSGYQALYANTTGSYNSGSGDYSLYANTTGYGNTANGFVALSSNTTGNYNTASGYEALYSNTTPINSGDSTYNTAAGYEALVGNTTGFENTASGAGALAGNTTGYYNTAMGRLAFSSNTTGELNTGLGFLTSVCTGNLVNATAVGAEASVCASNALVLGTSLGYNGMANTNVGVDVTAPSNIFTVLQGGGPAIADGWATYSSRRWKSDIQPLQGALGKVQRLRGVSYTYTANGKRDIGMIAEEVGKVMPEVVSYEDNGKDARGIDYARLTALLVEAVKDQQKQVQQQQAEIRRQQAQINRLKSEVRVLEGTK